MTQLCLLDAPERQWPCWYHPAQNRPDGNRLVAAGLHPLGATLGPERSKCGACLHLVHHRVFWKCRMNWKEGPTTEVVLGWRGCSSFSPALGDAPASWVRASGANPVSRESFGEGGYRWLLRQTWGAGPRLLWVLLNPSTADAKRDDMTTTRCRGFAARAGYGGYDLVNLYARRATHPQDLRDARDPVGREADAWIIRAAAQCADVAVGWGDSAELVMGAADRIAHVLGLVGTPRCLGVTKRGHPRHPSRLASDTPWTPWTPR